MRSPGAVPHPEHPSYQRHKQQLWAQILLPVIVAAVLMIVVVLMTVRAAFQTGGDVGRWAAISTMWLVLPVMLGGVIVLAVLGTVIVMLAKVAGVIPPYSYRAQRFFYRIEYGAKRGAEMVHRPVLFVHGMISAVRAAIHKARERIG